MKNPVSPSTNLALGKGLLAFALALTLVVPFANQAYAGTIFTYSGTGIQNKASVHTGHASGTCYVSHTQKRDYPANYGMTVQIRRDLGWNNWSTEGSKTFYKDVTNGSFSTYCQNGNYQLYFKTTSSGKTFRISGKFYN